MSGFDRGVGKCPKCGATVRLVAFRGPTRDSRTGSSVIGRHHVQLQRLWSYCKGEQQTPLGAA